jgi:hypothetical protein
MFRDRECMSTEQSRAARGWLGWCIPSTSNGITPTNNSIPPGCIPSCSSNRRNPVNVSSVQDSHL